MLSSGTKTSSAAGHCFAREKRESHIDYWWPTRSRGLLLSPTVEFSTASWASGKDSACACVNPVVISGSSWVGHSDALVHLQPAPEVMSKES